MTSPTSLDTLVQKVILNAHNYGADVLLKNVSTILHQAIRNETNPTTMKTVIGLAMKRKDIPEDMAEVLEKITGIFLNCVPSDQRNDEHKEYTSAQDIVLNLQKKVKEKVTLIAQWHEKMVAFSKKSFDVPVDQLEAQIAACEAFLREINDEIIHPIAMADIRCGVHYTLSRLYSKTAESYQLLCPDTIDISLLRKAHELICKSIDTKKQVQKLFETNPDFVPTLMDVNFFSSYHDRELSCLHMLETKLKSCGEKIESSPLDGIDFKNCYNHFILANYVSSGDFEKALEYAKKGHAKGKQHPTAALFHAYKDTLGHMYQLFLNKLLSVPEIKEFVKFFEKFYADLKKLDATNIQPILFGFGIEDIQEFPLFDQFIDAMLIIGTDRKAPYGTTDTHHIVATQKVIFQNLIRNRRSILNTLLGILIHYTGPLQKKNLSHKVEPAVLFRIQHYCNARRIQTIVLLKQTDPLPDLNERTMVLKFGNEIIEAFFYIQNELSDPIPINPKDLVCEFPDDGPITMIREEKTEEIFSFILRTCMDKRTSICGLIDAILNEIADIENELGTATKFIPISNDQGMIEADKKMAELIAQCDEEERKKAKELEKKLHKKAQKWEQPYTEPTLVIPSLPQPILSPNEQLYIYAVQQFPSNIEEAKRLCLSVKTAAEQENDYELVGKTIRFLGACAKLSGLRNLKNKAYLDALEELTDAEEHFRQALKFFETMVDKGLEISIKMENLSKIIQEDIEDVVMEIALFKKTSQEKKEAKNNLLEILEENAMRVRAGADPKKWNVGKPIEIQSKYVKHRLRLAKELDSLSEIEFQADTFMAELAPVAQCYRLLNINRGRSPINQYLSNSKTIPLEDLSQETFHTRIMMLSKAKFLELEPVRKPLMIEEERKSAPFSESGNDLYTALMQLDNRFNDGQS